MHRYRVTAINVSRKWIEWAEWAALRCAAYSPFPGRVYRRHPVLHCAKYLTSWPLGDLLPLKRPKMANFAWLDKFGSIEPCISGRSLDPGISTSWSTPSTAVPTWPTTPGATTTPSSSRGSRRTTPTRWGFRQGRRSVHFNLSFYKLDGTNYFEAYVHFISLTISLYRHLVVKSLRATMRHPSFLRERAPTTSCMVMSAASVSKVQV